MEIALNTRESWIDSWKGILIALVVLGHVVGGGAHLATGAAARWFCVDAYKIIYTFHMPAFFAVAGLLWSSGHETFYSFIRKKSVRLLLPYAIWGLFSVMAFLLLAPSVASERAAMTDSYYESRTMADGLQSLLSLLHAGGWPKGEGFRANGVLWFLPCFFTTQIVFWCIEPWVRRSRRLLAFLFAFCPVLGFALRYYSLQTLPWGVGKVPFYLFFMLWGWGCLPEIRNWLDRLRKGHGGGWLVLGLLTVTYILLLSQFPDLSLAYGDWFWYSAYLMMGTVGVTLSFMWSLCLDSVPLCQLGVHSLGIMLVHKFGVVLLQMKVPCLRNLFAGGLLSSVFGASCVTILVLVGAFFFSKVCIKLAPWMLGARTRCPR